MVDFYKSYQRRFERIERPAAGTMRLARTDAETAKIEALRALKDEFRKIAEAIESAVIDLQNEGKVDPDLSLALMIANHCAAGAAQLLVAALDGSETIRAAIDAMGEATEALGDIKKNTENLIADLDAVTEVLTTAGEVLGLIKT